MRVLIPIIRHKSTDRVEIALAMPGKEYRVVGNWPTFKIQFQGETLAHSSVNHKHISVSFPNSELSEEAEKLKEWLLANHDGAEIEQASLKKVKC